MLSLSTSTFKIGVDRNEKSKIEKIALADCFSVQFERVPIFIKKVRGLSRIDGPSRFVS